VWVSITACSSRSGALRDANEAIARAVDGDDDEDDEDEGDLTAAAAPARDNVNKDDIDDDMIDANADAIGDLDDRLSTRKDRASAHRVRFTAEVAQVRAVCVCMCV
jgi:hypothetical protein